MNGNKITEGLKSAIRYVKGYKIAVDPGASGGDFTCKTTYKVNNGKVTIVKTEYTKT